MPPKVAHAEKVITHFIIIYFHEKRLSLIYKSIETHKSVLGRNLFDGHCSLDSSKRSTRLTVGGLSNSSSQILSSSLRLDGKHLSPQVLCGV